ncbi:MAG: hypothetical protein K0Q55_1089 [Verrucomicrobia bacterium]|jgi:hypothetical protein|nr:hypothetical protein [Verrucomicrobiota bacterium]
MKVSEEGDKKARGPRLGKPDCAICRPRFQASLISGHPINRLRNGVSRTGKEDRRGRLSDYWQPRAAAPLPLQKEHLRLCAAEVWA